MPPPMIAMRGGVRGGMVDKRGTYDDRYGPFRLPPSPQAASLPDVAAGVPGPIGSRVCAEAPFDAERKREIVLRGDAAVAQRELVSELGSSGQPAAERIFQTDADGKRPESFITAVAAVCRVIDFRRADAHAPVGTEERVAPRVVHQAGGLFHETVAAFGVAGIVR